MPRGRVAISECIKRGEREKREIGYQEGVGEKDAVLSGEEKNRTISSI